jgi:hypothetical protein
VVSQRLWVILSHVVNSVSLIPLISGLSTLSLLSLRRFIVRVLRSGTDPIIYPVGSISRSALCLKHCA